MKALSITCLYECVLLPHTHTHTHVQTLYTIFKFLFKRIEFYKFSFVFLQQFKTLFIAAYVSVCVFVCMYVRGLCARHRHGKTVP